MTRLADGSMVVLHLDRGLVFSLNETAAALVSAVMAGREDVESIEQALGTEFDLEGVNVEQEVERVLLAFSCLQNGLAEAARRP